MHPLKATRSVEVNEEGNDISFKAGHFLKASSLMKVTEEKIDNERDLLFSVIKRGVKYYWCRIKIENMLIKTNKYKPSKLG